MSAFASAAANLTLIQHLLQNNKKYNAWTITYVDAVAYVIKNMLDRCMHYDYWIQLNC